MLSTDIPVILLLLAQLFFVLATVIFAISAIDDLLIDAYFYPRLIFRKLRGKNHIETPPVDSLLEKPEQSLALMLPAWQESDVLFGAVANLIKTIDYKNYHVFIGVYPNDKETQAEADRLSEQFHNVHKVVARLPGPTCKADCLNNVISSLLRYELKHGINFAGVIMQDAEDIIHPLSMKLFNYYLPEHDLIQIPVYSLKRKWWQLTGGHYMDEFAEFHSKEILVRQWFANVVPGAGVGTAMSKLALAYAYKDSGEIYNTHSLTEDYEFSFRTQGSRLKQVFARIPVPNRINKRYKIKVATKGDKSGNLIATREFFPNRFWWAVRQKTRWTIGISFQAWASMGWKGTWRVKYLFWRDRKMIFFSHGIAMGLISILIFSGYQLYGNLVEDSYHLAPLIGENSLLWNLVYFNLSVMAFRIIQRMGWTTLYYGWTASLMVIPRYIWAAIINYFAIVRATKAYLIHMWTKNPIGWDKTSHDLPEMEEANDMKLLLGELLVKKDLITQEQLDEALDIQIETKQQLGSVIVNKGWLSEMGVVKVMAEKYHLPVAEFDPFAIPVDVITIFPYLLLRKIPVIPYKVGNNRVSIASCKVLDRKTIEQLKTICKCQVDVHLTTKREINFSLYVFRKLLQQDLNTDAGLINSINEVRSLLSKMDIGVVAKMFESVREQHMSLGEILTSKGILDERAMTQYLQGYSNASGSFGSYLVKHGAISEDQRKSALSSIDTRFFNLMELYKDAVSRAAAA
jgi:adsorption protein B